MNKLIFLNILVLLTVVFSQCKRTVKDEELLGPEYRPAPEGFAITTSLNASNLSPSFNPGNVYFTGNFSHEVTWTLTITGETSGAQKVFTGMSNSLNASNTIWDGGASSGVFFKTNENLSAVLTFLGTSLSSTLNFSMQDAKPYSGLIDGVRYTIVENFETVNPSIPKYNLGSPFNDQGDLPVVNGFNTSRFVQGSRGYYFYGTDKNSNSWIAGVTTDSLNMDSSFRTRTTAPEDFYINLYVYGTGKANSSIQIKTYEIDNWSANTFKNVKYNQTINDGWVYDINIDWTGWKLVSVRYSNFKRAGDPNYGGNGNGILQPQNITGFALGLNSVPTFGNEVEAYVDFMVVTEGGPFRP